ncbi:hypothetical protein SLA2020_331390 [Shorea laevis]
MSSNPNVTSHQEPSKLPPAASSQGSATLPPPPLQPGTEGTWSSGLCDCLSDIPNCCITCWCPCVTFGQIAEIVDRGSTSCGVSGFIYALIYGCCPGWCCIFSCFYRTKMRKQYMSQGNPCADCLTHFFCECCALCQEHRELKSRGFDMSLGWHGNMQRQNMGVQMPPVMEGGMQR